MSEERKRRLVTCSFCGKNSAEQGPMVEGPGDIYMCGPCVDLAANIIRMEREKTNGPPCALCSRRSSEMAGLTMIFGGTLVCHFCLRELVDKALAEKRKA